jgi:hypothetical protein
MTTTLSAEDQAEALFVSPLQGSDAPTTDQIRAAVADMLHRLGAQGCAAMVAQEYGEHPDEAVRRMLWAIQTLRRGD